MIRRGRHDPWPRPAAPRADSRPSARGLLTLQATRQLDAGLLTLQATTRAASGGLLSLQGTRPSTRGLLPLQDTRRLDAGLLSLQDTRRLDAGLLTLVLLTLQDYCKVLDPQRPLPLMKIPADYMASTHIDGLLALVLLPPRASAAAHSARLDGPLSLRFARPAQLSCSSASSGLTGSQLRRLDGRPRFARPAQLSCSSASSGLNGSQLRRLDGHPRFARPAQFDCSSASSGLNGSQLRRLDGHPCFARPAQSNCLSTSSGLNGGQLQRHDGHLLFAQCQAHLNCSLTSSRPHRRPHKGPMTAITRFANSLFYSSLVLLQMIPIRARVRRQCKTWGGVGWLHDTKIEPSSTLYLPLPTNKNGYQHQIEPRNDHDRTFHLNA